MVNASRSSSQSVESSGVSLEDKIGFLSSAESWPGHPSCVTVVQTHHAWLFLTDCQVYKMKKPFRTGGRDFSSLESRHRLCLDEYRLNQRLAAQTYLGVVPLVLTQAGNLAVNEEGTVVEWLVKMRRLPETRVLTVLAAENRLTEKHVADFIRKLSRFHEQAPACRFDTGAYSEKLRVCLEFWHREIARSQPGRSEPPPGLAAAQLKYLDVRGGLLESRQREGRVRVVHGDLRPEHVFILEDEEPQIIDCLEFDADLRRLDVSAEVGYFAMECRHVGLGSVARRCIAEYHSRCPGCLGPGHLMDFYASLAATVRAGLMGWRALETPAGEESYRRMTGYLKDAQHYIDKASSRPGISS